ncbi:histidine kinase [Pedobacter psychrodurus]|uniref:Histidine kinase n=1 Tax=Pedobacter psychrodurus TaxID=2530456 RepID=A0A4R0Q1J4_9SPHI|nr:histidine kinase [Pedobacter psychrodurus]TCD26517.1 histidine kinase [Pedobacter psychrodurus]
MNNWDKIKYDHGDLSDTRMISFIVDKRFRILRHSVLLLGMLIMIYFSNEINEFPGYYRFYRLVCVFGAIVIMCYLNMNILVPLFFFRGKYLIYILLLIILVISCLSLVSHIFDILAQTKDWKGNWREANEERKFYEGTIVVIPIILVTTMIKLFQRWVRDRNSIAELKNITLKMELNELKNQINPHFLFNMLNGIKSLIRTDPEKAGVVILKLSEFLRYQLYENNEAHTILGAEIHFLTNFLELEKLRRDNFSVEIQSKTDPSVLNSVFLPPNLFTTFVENAVKHSVDVSGGKSQVRVGIEVVGKNLTFTCSNSRDPNYRPQDEKNSGLGLANVKRRLELLYADHYTLDLQSGNLEYVVILKIEV